MTINSRLKALRAKKGNSPYGFTRLERFALMLCFTSFALSVAAALIVLVRAVLRL